MRWQDLNREVASKLQGDPALADERPFILIDSSKQRLDWINLDAADNLRFPVSTAAKGIGNRLDSLQTPFGIHRIRQKIGGGQPLGAVFKAREPSGKVVKHMDNRDEDEITSRILWLDGLEEGVNRGGVYDTFSRYIYIHGTSDEKRIGQAVSGGCIRMKNDDVIALFDQVLINDLVIIR